MKTDKKNSAIASGGDSVSAGRVFRSPGSRSGSPHGGLPKPWWSDAPLLPSPPQHRAANRMGGSARRGVWGAGLAGLALAAAARLLLTRLPVLLCLADLLNRWAQAPTPSDPRKTLTLARRSSSRFHVSGCFNGVFAFVHIRIISDYYRYT